LKEALEKEDDTFKYFCLQCTKAKKASGGKSGKQSVVQKRVGTGMINQSEDN
jgi:hypothetical protein